MVDFITKNPTWRICKVQEHNDGTDMTYDDNGEPTIGLFRRGKYRFLGEDDSYHIGILSLIDPTQHKRRHKLEVKNDNHRRKPIYETRDDEGKVLPKNRMIPCAADHEGVLAKQFDTANAAGGGKRRKKKSKKSRGKRGGRKSRKGKKARKSRKSKRRRGKKSKRRRRRK